MYIIAAFDMPKRFDNICIPLTQPHSREWVQPTAALWNVNWVEITYYLHISAFIWYSHYCIYIYILANIWMFMQISGMPLAEARNSLLGLVYSIQNAYRYGEIIFFLIKIVVQLNMFFERKIQGINIQFWIFVSNLHGLWLVFSLNKYAFKSIIIYIKTLYYW